MQHAGERHTPGHSRGFSDRKRPSLHVMGQEPPKKSTITAGGPKPPSYAHIWRMQIVVSVHPVQDSETHRQHHPAPGHLWIGFRCCREWGRGDLIQVSTAHAQSHERSRDPCCFLDAEKCRPGPGRDLPSPACTTFRDGRNHCLSEVCLLVGNVSHPTPLNADTGRLLRSVLSKGRWIIFISPSNRSSCLGKKRDTSALSGPSYVVEPTHSNNLDYLRGTGVVRGQRPGSLLTSLSQVPGRRLSIRRRISGASSSFVGTSLLSPL